MKMLTIGDIAQQAGVATSTIRYYERIGLLPPSTRVNTKRRYDTTILQKLNVIHMAQQAGFTIVEIQTLLHDFPIDTAPSERWQALAGKKIAEIETRMYQMQAMKALLVQTLQCHCATLEDCAVDNCGASENVIVEIQSIPTIGRVSVRSVMGLNQTRETGDGSL